MRRKQKRVAAGIVAGMIGGLAGAWAMNQFQAVASDIKKKQQERQPKQPNPPNQRSAEESDDATMKTADRLYQAVEHHPLSKKQKEQWGPVIHYAFGAAMGAFYGGLAAVLPVASSGFGTTFGAALWAVADEAAVPAFGLSKPPTEYPLSSHAMALASHLVWGTTTEAVRRIAA